MSSNNSLFRINTISTAVPFLRIGYDARSGAMGDVGVAISPDANAMYFNPAKIVFSEKTFGLAASYAPWLRSLVNDIYLANLSAYQRIDKNQAFGFSLVYFNLGEVNFTGTTGNNIFTRHELAASVAFASRLSDRFSASLAYKFIYSNIGAGQSVGGVLVHPGKAVAADLSIYYNSYVKLFNYDAHFAFGAKISNFGTKITYGETIQGDFIPINLGVGTALEIELDAFNEFTIAFDINKLLVPTPDPLNPNQNVPVINGVLGSFTDAPGGFREEIHELMYSFGLEYWYSNKVAVRAGYFNEHATKGNRKYFTTGLGLKIYAFGLDVSYLIPTNPQRNPLDNTLKFTLLFDIE